MGFNRSSRRMKFSVQGAITALLLIGSLSIGGCSCSAREKPAQTGDINSPAGLAFLKELRMRIASGAEIRRKDFAFQELFSKTNFPKNFYAFALVLYQPGQQRIFVYREKGPPSELIREAVNAMIAHPRTQAFSVSNPRKSRLQMDFVLEKPEAYDFDAFSEKSLKSNRFEIGVDGLVLSVPGGRTEVLLPGDGFVRSVSGKKSLGRYLWRLAGSKTKLKDIALKRFRSLSYVSYQDRWLPLYRGYPVVGSLSKADLEKTIDFSVRWVLKTQKADGRFLYYYDAANNSFLDHEHPKRDPRTHPYYNELRHAGGALLLLQYYRQYRRPEVLAHVRSAIDFLIKHMVIYRLPDDREAAYLFYNKKAKLGSSGLALGVLAEYQRLTEDERYREKAELLKNHIVNEIRESGEFYYYHIYPGRTKDDRRSFSFYYPGEALLGLAVYYKHLAPEKEKPGLRRKIEKALRFLVFERPKLYADKFTSLPSDSWLMMAIHEIWDAPELRDDAWKKFVFEDADKMAKLMYTPEDALYPDYAGSFYYKYGDPPYPDGARCEGLLGAYELAIKTQSQEQIDRYGKALKMAAWAVMHLVNTPESTYSVPNPNLAAGGIRFKLTRQWFRIDTIQHVASFYLKFLPYLQSNIVGGSS